MGMNLSYLLDSPVADRVAAALEVLALNSSGQVTPDLNWTAIKSIVRGGLAPKAFDIGTQFALEHETSMSASIGESTGITAASVVEATFLAADGIIGTGIHVFRFTEGTWHYHDESVALSHFGITVTGTPVDGDEVIITEAYENDDMDVVTMQDAENAQGETVPALWLESHWALTGVQFDASEAIWACVEALPAGTYHFTIGQNWGTHCIKDKVYQFTLEHEVPVGGQIVIGNGNNFYTWGAPDVNPSNWKANTFSGPKSVTPIDGPVDLTEGSGGTDLGTISTTTKYSATGGVLNNLQRAAYGYGRWSQCAVRQYLNSAAGVGEWWEPQNPFDRPPQQLATMRGFMAGLPSDFIAAVQPVKVVTALNMVTDSDIGTTETTYDRFFIASLEQEYIAPQLANVEGPYWPYWKERLGLSSPQPQGSAGTNPRHIRYAVGNHASAQYVRLRSAFRGSAYSTWFVTTSGFAYGYYGYAAYAHRLAPACVIC